MKRGERGSILVFLLLVSALIALSAAFCFRAYRRASQQKRVSSSAQRLDQDDENSLSQSLKLLDRKDRPIEGMSLQLLSAVSADPDRVPVSLLIKLKHTSDSSRLPDWTRISKSAEQIRCGAESSGAITFGGVAAACSAVNFSADRNQLILGNLAAENLYLRCRSGETIRLAVAGELSANRIEVEFAGSCRIELVCTGRIHAKLLTSSRPQAGELLVVSTLSAINVDGVQGSIDFCSGESPGITARLEAQRISAAGRRIPTHFFGCTLGRDLLFWPPLKVLGKSYF